MSSETKDAIKESLILIERQRNLITEMSCKRVRTKMHIQALKGDIKQAKKYGHTSYTVPCDPDCFPSPPSSPMIDPEHVDYTLVSDVEEKLREMVADFD